MREAPLLGSLYVITFPCGAYKVYRDEDTALCQGRLLAEQRSCCARGHGAFRLELWSPEAVLRSFTDSKQSVSEESQSRLRIAR